jgi:hypothetical protein
MKTPDFHQRPTAQAALQSWLEIKSKLEISMARWRLSKRDEFVGLRVMRDAVSVVQQSFGDVARMLNPQVSISFVIRLHIHLMTSPATDQDQDLVKPIIRVQPCYLSS